MRLVSVAELYTLPAYIIPAYRDLSGSAGLADLTRMGRKSVVPLDMAEVLRVKVRESQISLFVFISVSSFSPIPPP